MLKTPGSPRRVAGDERSAPLLSTSVGSVIVLDSVLEALLTHALTTEREEVLGLCFGHFYDEDPISKAKQSVVLISGMTTLRRRDKRPDRVEVSDGDLSGASAAAEKEGLRVVGWYHSHPRITLPPSHVDLRTQLLYQYLDARFVGLIVSAFDRTRGRIGLGAFQTMVSSSHDSSHPHRANANKVTSHCEASVPVRILRRADIPVGSPLASGIPPVSKTIVKLVELMGILRDEERESYQDSLSHGEAGTSSHPFAQMYSSAIFQKALVRLLEYSVTPMIAVLEDRKRDLQERLAALRQ